LARAGARSPRTSPLDLGCASRTPARPSVARGYRRGLLHPTFTPIGAALGPRC
jgi:hypothetical protein